MSYEKQTWQTGDTVTSAKLNHMEDGIEAAGGVLIVHIDDDTGALDKTWQEIHDALAVGQIPVVAFVNNTDAGISILGWVAYLDNVYGIWEFGANVGTDDPLYAASSATDYPIAN